MNEEVFIEKLGAILFQAAVGNYYDFTRSI